MRQQGNGEGDGLWKARFECFFLVLFFHFFFPLCFCDVVCLAECAKLLLLLGGRHPGTSSYPPVLVATGKIRDSKDVCVCGDIWWMVGLGMGGRRAAGVKGGGGGFVTTYLMFTFCVFLIRWGVVGLITTGKKTVTQGVVVGEGCSKTALVGRIVVMFASLW